MHYSEIVFVNTVSPAVLECELGDCKFSADAIVFGGVDPDGLSAAYLVIVQLAPKATFTAKLRTQKKQPAQEQRDLAITLLHFEALPVGKVLTSDGKLAISFIPPEGVKIEGIGIVCEPLV